MPVSVEAVGVETVAVRLRAMNASVREALIAAVGEQAKELVRVIKEEKLSGQVLGQRTGRLRNSIHSEVFQTSTGVHGAAGTDVVYGAFWEYGFQGTEQVREHLRKMTQAWGRPVTGREILVRAHSREVNSPARSFLRSALADREPAILAALEAAVQMAVEP